MVIHFPPFSPLTFFSSFFPFWGWKISPLSLFSYDGEQDTVRGIRVSKNPTVVIDPDPAFIQDKDPDPNFCHDSVPGLEGKGSGQKGFRVATLGIPLFFLGGGDFTLPLPSVKSARMSSVAW